MPGTDPISFERIVDRTRPSSPRVSPDGHAVAYTLSYVSRKDDRARSTIWMARDGAEPFAFTGGKAGASEPDWSPDGSRLVFTSTRDDKDDRAGLFLIPAAGGEAQQLGEVRGEISQPRWAPDGSLIAFLMADPETDDDKKRKEDKRDHIVVEEEPKHQRLWVIAPESGSHRCLTTASHSVLDYEWAPDGRELVIVTAALPTANARFGTTRLASVPVTGGIERQIATFPTAPGSPVVREVDGRRVVAVIGDDHRAAPSPSIWCMPWDGGPRRNVLPELHGSVEDIIADPCQPGLGSRRDRRGRARPSLSRLARDGTSGAALARRAAGARHDRRWHLRLSRRSHRRVRVVSQRRARECLDDRARGLNHPTDASQHGPRERARARRGRPMAELRWCRDRGNPDPPARRGAGHEAATLRADPRWTRLAMGGPDQPELARLGPDAGEPRVGRADAEPEGQHRLRLGVREAAPGRCRRRRVEGPRRGRRGDDRDAASPTRTGSRSVAGAGAATLPPAPSRRRGCSRRP